MTDLSRKVMRARSGGAPLALGRAHAGSVAHMEKTVYSGSVRSPPVGARQARLQDETSRLFSLSQSSNKLLYPSLRCGMRMWETAARIAASPRLGRLGAAAGASALALATCRPTAADTTGSVS